MRGLGDQDLFVCRFALDDPSLASMWTRLQGVGGVPSPFLTWEWVGSLAETPELCRNVQVLVCYERDHVAGLLPLQWSSGSGRLREVRIAGHWLAPDHLDVVSSPGHEHAVAAAVLTHLVEARDWELLELSGLAECGALAAALRRLRPPRFAYRVKEVLQLPWVELAGKDAAEVLPRRNLRQQVGRGRRVAERSGGGFTTVREPASVGPLLEEMMRLHNMRWGSASTVFATAARRDFHRRAVRRLAAADLMRFYRLRVGEIDAAVLYALRLDRRLYYYSMGMTPEAGLSPGRTVLGQAILSAAEEGLEEFDLLRGEHDFKLRFATGVRSNLHVQVARVTPRSGLAVGRWASRAAVQRARAKLASARTNGATQRDKIADRGPAADEQPQQSSAGTGGY